MLAAGGAARRQLRRRSRPRRRRALFRHRHRYLFAHAAGCSSGGAIGGSSCFYSAMWRWRRLAAVRHAPPAGGVTVMAGEGQIASCRGRFVTAATAAVAAAVLSSGGGVATCARARRARACRAR